VSSPFAPTGGRSAPDAAADDRAPLRTHLQWRAARHSSNPATALRDWAKNGRLPVATYVKGPYRARHVIRREERERVLRQMRNGFGR